MHVHGVGTDRRVGCNTAALLCNQPFASRTDALSEAGGGVAGKVVQAKGGTTRIVVRDDESTH
jgi:hypothetical protein